MNYLGVHQTPDLLEEVWLELQRERDQAQRIRQARDARQRERGPRFLRWAERLRGTLQPEPCL